MENTLVDFTEEEKVFFYYNMANLAKSVTDGGNVGEVVVEYFDCYAKYQDFEYLTCEQSVGRA